MDKKFLMAVTGQIGLEHREGIFINFTLSLLCNVLDHFNKRCIPGGAKNTSVLDK